MIFASTVIASYNFFAGTISAMDCVDVDDFALYAIPDGGLPAACTCTGQ
jgi:hypothetical protein